MYIVSCPNLDNPDNGFVTLDGTSLDSIAMYSCNTGFKLDGPETLTCANDGTWSGEPPTCSESKQCHEYLYSLIDISYVRI